MFDATDLFKQRLTDHIKLLNRYLRYLFNGHFMIALLFIIITLAVYYQKGLENIEESFPASIVIALILGFVVSYNPIQTFLKEPDQVFIIVKENEMKRYFRNALLYNYAVQLYMVIIAAAVVGPLYRAVHLGEGKFDFLLLMILVSLIKAWNLVTNFIMMKIRHRINIVLDKVLRIFLSMMLFYCFLESFFVIPITVIYFVVIFLDFYFAQKQSGLAWDVLIANDQHRLAVFYRFVSMFADVPQIKKQLKKRMILAKFIQRTVAFKQEATFAYLYRLSFIRSNDYFGLFVRLTVIGAVAIYFVPNGWLKIALALLFMYMTSFQLIPLYRHYRTSIWVDLYPIDKEDQRATFLQLVMRLTIIQTIIFAGLFFIWLNLFGVVITLIAGSLFNYVFHQVYVKKKIAAN